MWEISFESAFHIQNFVGFVAFLKIFLSAKVTAETYIMPINYTIHDISNSSIYALPHIIIYIQ